MTITPGIEVETMKDALTTIEAALQLDDSATFTVDVHPEGMYRVRWSTSTTTFYTMHPCMDSAIIEVAQEIYSRLA